MKDFRKFRVAVYLLLIFNSIVYAQEVNFSNFILIQYKKTIDMYWTINSGSICSGITIFRSLDSLNFEEIGYIGGVCGSSTNSTNYDFTDKNPVLNTTNYYKLRFGISQDSEIHSFYPTYVEPNDMKLRPNPATDIVYLDLNKDQNFIFTLKVYNDSGVEILSQTNLFGESLNFDVSHFSSGIYYVELIDEDRKKIRKKMSVIDN